MGNTWLLQQRWDNSFLLFSIFKKKIFPRSFWIFLFLHLCRKLLPTTTSRNMLKNCIMNFRLWWFGTWILWRSTTCPRFWITRIATCKTHHFIERTRPMLVELRMHIRSLYLFSMGPKEKRFASSRKLFYVNLISCLFSLKTWKHFCISTISFLKLCANWVHVSLGFVNNFSFVNLNVHVCCFRNLLLEILEVEQP